MPPFHRSKIPLKNSPLPLPFTLHLKTPTLTAWGTSVLKRLRQKISSMYVQYFSFKYTKNVAYLRLFENTTRFLNIFSYSLHSASCFDFVLTTLRFRLVTQTLSSWRTRPFFVLQTYVFARKSYICKIFSELKRLLYSTKLEGIVCFSSF